MTVSKNAGFSLMELLIVTAILGILLSVTMPNLLQAISRANDTASKAYINHVVNGVEAAREGRKNALPPTQNCAAFVNIPADPESVKSCEYTADLDHDSYKVTAVSVTGKTFQYDGSKIILVE